MNEKLRVNELFQSIQGESTLAGLPFTFIRLAGCNLRCRWCDTPSAAEGKGKQVKIHEILNSVETFANKYVCITGGEPMIQENTHLLCEKLLRQGFEVCVETNGSLDISEISTYSRRIMDVKCPSSGECASNLFSNFSSLNSRDNLKFVIADRADFDWAIDLIAGHKLSGRCPLIFAPAISREKAQEPNEEVDELLSKGKEISNWILESGAEVRMQLQIHKLLRAR